MSFTQYQRLSVYIIDLIGEKKKYIYICLTLLKMIKLHEVTKTVYSIAAPFLNSYVRKVEEMLHNFSAEQC